jgi:hypothetical protein
MGGGEGTGEGEKKKVKSGSSYITVSKGGRKSLFIRLAFQTAK